MCFTRISWLLYLRILPEILSLATIDAVNYDFIISMIKVLRVQGHRDILSHEIKNPISLSGV
jgi:hypothetical protein